MKLLHFGMLLSVIFFSYPLTVLAKTAPVTGFARSLFWNLPIADATITILETGQQLKTDDDGRFGPIHYPVGKPITLELKKFGFKTTQTATFIVPAQGMHGSYNNITFQVPSTAVYYTLAIALGAKNDGHSCHVATTLTGFHKTINDLPKGEMNAKITLSREHIEPVYFDTFKKGPLHGMFNPFRKDLTVTSEDGGAVFLNVPVRDKAYMLSAKKTGMRFTKVKFICRKDAFINISAPILHAQY